MGGNDCNQICFVLHKVRSSGKSLQSGTNIIMAPDSQGSHMTVMCHLVLALNGIIMSATGYVISTLFLKIYFSL